MSDLGSAKQGDPLGDLIRTGDPEQIASVLYPRARRIAGRILFGRDPDLIETAAGDAVLAVCRHRAGFRCQARASTWVHTIARRAAIRCARREVTYRERILPWSAEIGRGELAGDRSLLSCPLSAREAIQTLEEAVPNPTWRRLWLMWNDPEAKWSRAEIASQSGYSPGSAEVILSRVRAQIRAAHAREIAGV